MAACSEEDVSDTGTEESHDSAFSLAPVLLKQHSAKASQPAQHAKTHITGLQQAKRQNDRIRDVADLPEDELQQLLEEAVTFNKPEREASDLLQQLRRQIAENELCEDVDRKEPSLVSCSVGSGRSRKSRGGVPGGVKGRGPLAGDILPAADTLVLGNGPIGATQKVLGGAGKKRNLPGTRSGEELSPRSSIPGCSTDKKGLQSQSLQDLASARFGESSESMRSAGIGRGARKLHRATRANSLTLSQSDGSEWMGVHGHFGAPESSRASPRTPKTKSNKPKPQHSFSLPDEIGAYEGCGSDACDSRVNASTPGTPNGPMPYPQGGRNGCDVLSSSLTFFGPHEAEDSSRGVSTARCGRVRSSSSCDFERNRCHGTSELLENSHVSHDIEMVEFKRKGKRAGEPGDSVGSSQDCYSTSHAVKENCKGGFEDPTVDVDEKVSFPQVRTYGRKHRNESEKKTLDSNAGMLLLVSLSNQADVCTLYTTVADSPATKMSPYQQTMSLPEQYKSVQSIISSGGEDQLVYSCTKDDTRGPSVLDMNGNPVPFPFRPHAFSRIVNSPDGLVSAISNSSDVQPRTDANVRKGKRSRSNMDSKNFVLAENIEGHRGKEDIEKLLEYINSSDKKSKSHVKGSNGPLSGIGQVADLGARTCPLSSEPEKKRSYTREGRNNQQPRATLTSVSKKDGTSSSAGSDEGVCLLEDVTVESQHFEDDVQCDSLTLFGEVRLQESANHSSDASSSTVEEEGDKVLLLSSETCADAEMDATMMQPSTCTDEDVRVSSFANDFYSVIDVGQQFQEESEFRVVMKKQRKRRQFVSTSEVFRRHSASVGASCPFSAEQDYYLQDQISHGEGIILLTGLPLSHRNQRGSQDPIRRKSTSSVPPSEHSSAENSDLDSVHSLPVGGSKPLPTRAHPHTTPSSTSSTPQASYADIARMSKAMMPKLKAAGCHGTVGNNPIEKLPGVSGNSADLVGCANCSASLIFMDQEGGDIAVGVSGPDLTCKNPNPDNSPPMSNPTTGHDPGEKALPGSAIEGFIPVAAASSTAPLGLGSTSSFVLPRKTTAGHSKNTRESITQTDPMPSPFPSIPAFSSVNVTPHPDQAGPSRQEATGDRKQEGPSMPSAFTPKSSTPAIGSDVQTKSKNGTTEGVANPGDSSDDDDGPEQGNMEPSSSPVSFGNSPSGAQLHVPAVVIMENCLPSEDISDVTFGFEINEQLLLMTCPSAVHLESSSSFISSGKDSSLSTTNNKVPMETAKHRFVSPFVPATVATVPTAIHTVTGSEQTTCSGSPHAQDTSSLSGGISDLSSHKQDSSPVEEVLLVSAQPVQWKDLDIDNHNFNHDQVVNFIGCAWDTVQQDYEKDAPSDKEGKIVYYSDH